MSVRSHKFNIIMREEWQCFVAKVLENNVSSFWKTKQEALDNVYEALELYYESEEKISDVEIKSPVLLQYSFA